MSHCKNYTNNCIEKKGTPLNVLPDISWSHCIKEDDDDDDNNNNNNNDIKVVVILL